MVASTVDTSKEKSLRRKEDVNSSSYLNFHNSQMFADGLSFSGYERNPLWINRGLDQQRSFASLSALSGADTPNDSRAVLAVDFDDDGDLDLFVHSIQRERHALFRNDISAAPSFIKLRLAATSGNPEAIGAKVVVKSPLGATAQVLSRGAGFASCQPPELVFGLGEAQSGQVEVLWPGGTRESFGDLAAGTRALLVEGTGQAQPIKADPRPLPDPLPQGLRLADGELLEQRYSAFDRDGQPVVLDPVALADGRSLLLNLWASYCAPCVAELPYLQQIWERGDVVVVTLSVDVPEDRQRAVAALERAGANFPAFFLTGDETRLGTQPKFDGAGVKLTGLEELIDLERLALPTTIVFSPEGRVESILRGPLQPEEESDQGSAKNE